jgi:signal transduction histidine kinase
MISSDPIIDGEGRITRIVHRFKDITSQKESEAETSVFRRHLQRSERLLRMGELTASLAHELNQPLTSILGNARAALRFIENDRIDMAELKEILEDIANDDKRAGEIIRSLRSMFKQEEGDREPVAINALLQEVLGLLKSEAIVRNLRIEMELDDLLPPVTVNKTQLQQVMINIIMNAAESMSGASEDRRIMIRTQRPSNDFVQVAVADRGTGIGEKDVTRIFEPFFSKKGTGLGLGLSISRTIIQAHGGEIWAANNPDKGATFFFNLPVAGTD